VTYFCCDQMRAAVESDEIPVEYSAKFREIGLRILDGGTSTVVFEACPWCGQKLPTSLRDDRFSELGKRGIDPVTDVVPPEFTDERWYASRDRQ